MIGLSRDNQLTITRGDDTRTTADGIYDPQAMPIILLQILTGRRASEIRTRDLDCHSSAPSTAADGQDTR